MRNTWLLLALSTGGAVALAAQGPAFNCAKAQGEVEKLICGDDALGALDRQLDNAYKAANAKASGTLAKELRSEQRG